MPYLTPRCRVPFLLLYMFLDVARVLLYFAFNISRFLLWDRFHFSVIMFVSLLACVAVFMRFCWSRTLVLLFYDKAIKSKFLFLFYILHFMS